MALFTWPVSVEKVEGFGFVGFVFLKLPLWPSLAHFSQQFSHFFPVSSFSRLSFPGMGTGIQREPHPELCRVERKQLRFMCTWHQLRSRQTDSRRGGN